jgi:hypothetical protein
VTILNPISHIERWGFAFELNRLDITKTAIVHVLVRNPKNAKTAIVHVLVRNPKNGQDIIFEISYYRITITSEQR